jgi:hypothetical protein
MNEYTAEFKGYYIKPYKEVPTCYQVVTVGKGGKIPDCLSGLFTSRTLAMREIDLYQARKQTKVSVDEADTTSGSK